MMVEGIPVSMEAIRRELECRLSPAFGLPLDIAAMLMPLPPPQEGDPRLHAPPLELQDIHHPRLMHSQWERLIALVHEPVQEIRTSQGFRAVQLLGQTVLLFLPSGLLHAWVWHSTQERGMHLKRLSHDTVALSGKYLDDGWLLRLADMASLEIRHYICCDGFRACACSAWTFEVFAKTLTERADLAWMRERLTHRLALDPKIASLAEQTISPLALPGSMTVAQYNHVRRRFAILSAVRRETPQLFGVYEALCAHADFPGDGEPVQRLKRFLKAKGLSQRGWNMVLSLTASDLAPLNDLYEGALQRALLNYVRLLDTLGLHREQPHWLVITLLDAPRGLPGGHGGMHPVFDAHLFLSHASHVVRLYFDASEAPTENQAQDLAVVVDWLSTLLKPLTRTQKRGGWLWLLRKAREWKTGEDLRAQAQYGHWPTPFRTQQAGPLLLRGISDAHSLWAEGKAMSHCVGNYAAQCASGESLVCSVLIPTCIQ